MTYNKVATNETHSHCYEPLVRECDGEPAKKEVCKDWPETFCTTKYEAVSTVTAAEEGIDLRRAPRREGGGDLQKTNGDQFVSDTSCERVTTRVCVPVNCVMVPGQPQCHERVVPIIQQVPEEVSVFIQFQAHF